MQRKNLLRAWHAEILTLIFLLGASMATAQPLALSSIGKFSLPSGAPTGLSGLTYAGGNQYYAVEDSGARMYPLTISVNSLTGLINSATVSPFVQLSGADLEGVAYNVVNNSIYVSDESGPGIREYNLTGTLIGSVTVPAIYSNIRPNLSLESLSIQAGKRSIWTANEQALSVDGGTSNTSDGTTVRLQKFNSLLAPDGQWAYETDSVSGSFPSDSGEQVGVSDLLALPNGKVLVLERQADAYLDFITPSLRYKNRIYEVDFSSATDVSGLAALSGGGYVPVDKTLLWDSPWFEEGNRDNFEGMTLGPQLDNGDFSVLLISDGDDSAGFAHGESLYALRLSGGINLPGDYNNDGLIDAADYTVWRDTLLNSVPAGTGADGNGDGFVEADDYTLWVNNYGTTSASSAVPEPGSGLLLLAGVLVIYFHGSARVRFIPVVRT